jgi:hypothetical protein
MPTALSLALALGGMVPGSSIVRQPAAAVHGGAPPDWPAAVHFSGTQTTTISTSIAGSPAPYSRAEHGSIDYWSSCSASEPKSGLLRQDTITLNPTTQQPLVNTTAVESCPDDKNYAQVTIAGVP